MTFHSPFPKIELVENWKSLNKGQGNIHRHEGFLKYPTEEDYSQAIAYQLKNIEKFILDNDHSSNDIFLLMGDHQPPALSKPSLHGLNTPVHVVSKNMDFLNNFSRYGFDEKFDPDQGGIKHEAIYSIFLKAFAQQYAKSSHQIPSYEPDGIQI